MASIGESTTTTVPGSVTVASLWFSAAGPDHRFPRGPYAQRVGAEQPSLITDPLLRSDATSLRPGCHAPPEDVVLTITDNTTTCSAADAHGNPISGPAAAIPTYDAAMDRLARLHPEAVALASVRAEEYDDFPMGHASGAYLALIATDTAQPPPGSLDELLVRWPSDLLAVVIGHQRDFFLGDAQNLGDPSGPVVARLQPAHPHTASSGHVRLRSQGVGPLRTGGALRYEAVGANPDDDVWASTPWPTPTRCAARWTTGFASCALVKWTGATRTSSLSTLVVTLGCSKGRAAAADTEWAAPWRGSHATPPGMEPGPRSKEGDHTLIRVRTAKSVYQIRKGVRAFRRIGGTAGEGAPPLGVWRAFEQMGPVIVGRPLRFFLSLSGNSRQMSRVQTLTTSPVVEIIDESAGRNHHEASVATGGGLSR